MQSKLRDTFNLYAAARKRDLRERAHMREEIDKERGKFQYFPLYDPPEGEWHIFTLLAAIIFCLPLKAADKVLEPMLRAAHYDADKRIFSKDAWWVDPQACIDYCDEMDRLREARQNRNNNAVDHEPLIWDRPMPPNL